MVYNFTEKEEKTEVNIVKKEQKTPDTEEIVKQKSEDMVIQQEIDKYYQFDAEQKLIYNQKRQLEALKLIDPTEKFSQARDYAIYKLIKDLTLNAHDPTTLDTLFGRFEILKHGIIKNIYADEVELMED